MLGDVGEQMQMNRLHNASNPYQGDFKRVLCICSAGLLRSPTIAWVLSQDPYNYNTRAAGIDHGHALVKVDAVLVSWADEIVVVDPAMTAMVQEIGKRTLGFTKKKIVELNISDIFSYRDPELVAMIKEQYGIPSTIDKPPSDASEYFSG